MKLSIVGKGVKTYFRLIGTCLVLIPLLAVSTGLNASAATSGQGSASGLSISPLRSDLTLTSGQANEINITLKNITGGPILAKVAVQDFESDNVSGNPKIITDPNFNDPSSIRNFLVGLGNVPLATGEQKTFNIPVQAPPNTPPGAYYGLIEYQAIPNNGGTVNGNNKVALSAAVSQLVFITVPGVVNERLQLTSVQVYHDATGTSQGLFFTHVPKSVGVQIHNYGNAFATPFGNVTLQNSEGKKIYSYELNGGITRGLMLPNSSRIFKNPIKNITRPGRYTVVVNASYGAGSAILTAKKSFWYIQTWLIIVIILIVALLVLAVWLARRRYKRATRRHHPRY